MAVWNYPEGQNPAAPMLQSTISLGPGRPRVLGGGTSAGAAETMRDYRAPAATTSAPRNSLDLFRRRLLRANGENYHAVYILLLDTDKRSEPWANYLATNLKAIHEATGEDSLLLHTLPKRDSATIQMLWEEERRQQDAGARLPAVMIIDPQSFKNKADDIEEITIPLPSYPDISQNTIERFFDVLADSARKKEATNITAKRLEQAVNIDLRKKSAKKAAEILRYLKDLFF
jgi:hypothetical protein